MSEYNTKNYTEQGGEVTHIGGELAFDAGASGVIANRPASTAATIAALKEDFNALISAMKACGIMTGDDFTITTTKSITDSQTDRAYNTGKISSVAESGGVITITLSEKVANLKDFDGGNGWGTHKWLGIGISAGVSPITGLTYNGAALTTEDVTEATACGLAAGYFVRWVAADLVLAGDNTQKSKNSFTLWASGYAQTEYTLKIIEPS